MSEIEALADGYSMEFCSRSNSAENMAVMFTEELQHNTIQLLFNFPLAVLKQTYNTNE